MPFTFKKLSLPDVILIEPRVFPDERGFFLESYKSSEFKNAGLDVSFVQDNHSLSQKGVIRGLHYQMPPKAQGKLVRVIKGSVYDVAVDIRRQSPTFLKWVCEELSESNHRMLYIPPGFAHGFAALTDDVHLVYKCTEEYAPQFDRGIRWDDAAINIAWNIDGPIVSDKDKALPIVKDAEVF